jgi:8-oxo-dGTP diphosphatase
MRTAFFFTDYHFKMTEHSEWRWAALTEIEALDFADSDRRLFPALQVYLETEAGINHR